MLFLFSGERKQEKSVFCDTEIPVLASSDVSHVLHNHSNPQLSRVSLSAVWCCFLLMFHQRTTDDATTHSVPASRGVWHSSPANALR